MSSEAATVMADAMEASGNIDFADGLFGFPGCTRFELRATSRTSFYWMQSLDEPAVAFVLVDPFDFVDNYVADIADTDVARLSAHQPNEVAVLAVATLPATPDQSITINLQAPIAINVATGVARQVVLNEATYGMRFPLPR
jgi:flagellar assembly factor FliW